MGLIWDRRTDNSRPAVGRLQAQDMGEEQAVDRVHGYVEFAGLRCCNGSRCESGSWT
jgi:hypothetical protein